MTETEFLDVTDSEHPKVREFEEMLVEYNILRNVITLFDPKKSCFATNYSLYNGRGEHLTFIPTSDVLSLPLSDLEEIVVSVLFG